MLRKLWSVFPGIPFLCLVDSNMGGANIFCTYRFGSEANAHDNLFLTVPELEFIGLDINDIPADKRTALSDDGKDKDLRDLTNLMSKKYTYDAVTFRTNLKSMNELRSKADIEILMKDKNLEQYILEKIAKRNKGTQAKNEVKDFVVVCFRNKLPIYHTDLECSIHSAFDIGGDKICRGGTAGTEAVKMNSEKRHCLY